MAEALLLIGGTTASGKSGLALRLAAITGGLVVNADAIQLYRDLPLLTARPDAADMARAEHRLYGLLDAGETGSAGRWLDLLAPVLAEAVAAGRTVILVGGSGLYLKALLHGLAPVPEIPPMIRAEVRGLARDRPAEALHALLAEADPVMAERLQPGDPQRVLRALEVLRATGRSLAWWQQRPAERLALPAWRGLALLPGRALLLPRVEARLDAMLATGALDELRDLLARPDLPADAPLLKGVGVPELRAVIEGRADLEAARMAAVTATLRYAKRQRTFFRHQLPELLPLEATAETVDQRQLEGWLAGGTLGA